MGLLNLKVVKVPNVLGIYGKSGDVFADSAAWLHPDAAAAYDAACKGIGRLRVSDMFRTAEQSLLARSQKTGVQPPGFSLHNYGIAIDIHTDDCLTRFKMTKPALDAAMKEYGWYCHRKDGKRGSEDWHYNFLGVGAAAEPFLAASAKSTNTSGAGDAKILSIYGDELVLTPQETQEALTKLKLYSGSIDGDLGPRSQQSIKAFQRAWKLSETGTMDSKTERTLAYVSANMPK